MFTTIQEDSSSRNGVIIAAVLIALVAAMHLISPVYTANDGLPVQWVYNILLILGSGSLAVMAGLLFRSFQRSKAKRRIWAMMTLGFFLWWVGDVLYAYNQLILQSEALYPSFADVSFALAYIPIGLALAFRVASFRTTPSTQKVIAITLIILIFGAAVINYGVIPVIGAEDTAFAQFITFLYPIGDLLLVAGAALVFLTLEGGKLALPWMLIPLGFLLFVIGDTSYAYAYNEELYLAGEGMPVNFITFVAEVAYFAAYAVTGAGFYLQGRLQRVF